MQRTASFMKRISMPILFVVLLNSSVEGQSWPIGSEIPFKLKQQLGLGEKKLVILHFWNTLCSGCISELLKIDSLQQKFDKDVEYVLISSQSNKVVNDFFAVRKKIVQPAGVVFINDDTVLKKYFPYQTVPHNVWLSNKGVVLAITTGAQTNVNSISGYLDKGVVNLAVKKEYVNYSWKVPVLSTHYSPASNLNQYHSYILPAVDSFYQTTEWRASGGSKLTNRMIINKSSIINLFIHAYNERGDQFSLRYGNVELQIKDSGIYLRPENPALIPEWEKQNLFLYDIQVPETKASKLYEYMRADIERIFNLVATVKMQKRKCLVLKLDGDESRLSSKGSKAGSFPPKEKGDSLWQFRNYPFESFKRIVGGYLRRNGYVLIDETGLGINVDLAINGGLIDKLDISILRRDLEKYGIRLEERECDAPVLLITEQ